MTQDDESHKRALESIQALSKISRMSNPSISSDFDSVMRLSGVSHSSAEYKDKTSKVQHPLQGTTYSTVRRISVDEPSCD